MTHQAPDDGIIRLKSQSELLQEEENEKAIKAQQEDAERAIQGQRNLIAKFAYMNGLQIETEIRQGQRLCSLVDPKNKNTEKRVVVVSSMPEQAFLQTMMQYLAEAQTRAANSGGEWEEQAKEG
jgi:hypothetical protein